MVSPQPVGGIVDNWRTAHYGTPAPRRDRSDRPEGAMTARELCARWPVSYRQLDYWARSGLLIPAVGASGSGSTRYYSPANIATLRVILPMIRMGALTGGARFQHRSADRPVARVARAVTEDPSIADRPLVYISAAGDIMDRPRGGWTIEPLDSQEGPPDDR